ncbi:MAG: CAP domain-containing protein [Lachnospiraceae bacterium]|nr:CAP domain-containing protein [Lachnospiraceae bacterium]
MRRKLAFVLLTVLVMSFGMTAHAVPKEINGVKFDADYYLSRNPDLKEVVGNDETALYNHYVTCGMSEGRKAVAVSTDASNKSAESMLGLINRERSSAGLSPLSLNEALCNAAYVRAKEMSDNKYFEHTRPDGSPVFGLVYSAMGTRRCFAGENIAMGFTSVEQVHSGWMYSPSHRANIMSGNYSAIGIARYGNYWVQMFFG